MISKKTKAFTLIELIVVITILAILGTISFISLQGYSQNARDSVRISDMKNIEKGLELELTKRGKVSIPDDKVDITASGTVISYQGYVGERVLDNIGVHGGGKDPIDEKYYTYMTSKNLTSYEILGYLESEEGLSFIENTYATDLSIRFPKVLGGQLGILLQSGSLEPVQDSLVDVDIVNTTENYVSYLDDDNIVNGTGVDLFTKIYNSSEEYLKNKELAKFDDSLVLYLDMETTTMSGSLKVMKDFSNYHNDGVCKESSNTFGCNEGNGGPVVKTNGGMFFDGINDYINVGKDVSNLTEFTLYTYFSISGDTGDHQGLIGNTATMPTGKGYFYGISNANKLWSLIFDGSEIQRGYNSTEIINNNNFYSYILTFNGFEAKFYLNGSHINTLSISGISPFITASTNIGKNLGWWPFYGLIKDARIYNRALSDKEIGKLHNNSVK